jgi:hypothetical protein
VPKKIDPLKKERAKSLYASGLPASEVANDIEVSMHTITSWAERGQWSQLRRDINCQSENLLVERIAADKLKATIDIIDPLVSHLTILAEEVLTKNKDELRAKDVLHPLGTLLRLRAKIKSEVSQKIEFGPTEQFMAIMEAVEKMPKSAIEPKKFNLIE